MSTRLDIIHANSVRKRRFRAHFIAFNGDKRRICGAMQYFHGSVRLDVPNYADSFGQELSYLAFSHFLQMRLFSSKSADVQTLKHLDFVQLQSVPQHRGFGKIR